MPSSVSTVFAFLLLIFATLTSIPSFGAPSDLTSKLTDMLWLLIPAGVFVGSFLFLEKKRKK